MGGSLGRWVLFRPAFHLSRAREGLGPPPGSATQLTQRQASVSPAVRGRHQACAFQPSSDSETGTERLALVGNAEGSAAEQGGAAGYRTGPAQTAVSAPVLAAVPGRMLSTPVSPEPLMSLLGCKAQGPRPSRGLPRPRGPLSPQTLSSSLACWAWQGRKT